MVQNIQITGVRIFAKTAPCAHSCRYCLVGRKGYTDLAFERFAHLVERFIDWRGVRYGQSLKLLVGFEDSYEFDAETLRGLFSLQRKVGWGETEANGIKLGGLRKRSDEEIRAWLSERQSYANLKTVHGSLAGCDAVHDRWNGRKGDFDYLFRIMMTAAELDLRLHQRIFVVLSTLPVLTRLIDKLNEIPGQALRYLSMFSYQGLAVQLEKERISETERDRLPPEVVRISKRAGEKWLSEREWIEDCREVIECEQPRPLLLSLEVTAENIANLENVSCEDVIKSLTQVQEHFYQTLPSRAELCERFGDTANTRIYASMDELERKWLMHYFSAQSLPVPRSLMI
jgi:hypothetical protein